MRWADKPRCDCGPCASRKITTAFSNCLTISTSGKRGDRRRSNGTDAVYRWVLGTGLRPGRCARRRRPQKRSSPNIAPAWPGLSSARAASHYFRSSGSSASATGGEFSQEKYASTESVPSATVSVSTKEYFARSAQYFCGLCVLCGSIPFSAVVLRLRANHSPLAMPSRRGRSRYNRPSRARR